MNRIEKADYEVSAKPKCGIKGDIDLFFHRLLSDSMMEVVSIHDDKSAIVFVSASCSRIFGRRADDLVGGVLQAFAHPGDRDALDSALKAGARGKPGRVEWRILRGDGDVTWHESEVMPVEGEKSRGCRVICRTLEVTRRKSLEFQLAQSQKLEAMGRLAANVAHDFNNLLTVIRGFGELLRDGLPYDSPDRDLAEEIVQAGERGAALTARLLAFGRRQPGNVGMLDINETLLGMKPLIENLLGEDIELMLELEPALAPVKAERGRFEQVVMNLVSNSRDAMEGCGRVCIRTKHIDSLEERASDRSGAPAGSYISLSVVDDGRGMDPLTLAHLFEPYFTTKEAKGGGLGLATVYGIVRQWHGHIEVTSRERAGTAVRILFPQPTGYPAEASDTTPDSGAVAGMASILLVEDDASVRMLTRKILTDAGYSVMVVGNGQEALDAYDARPGSFDLVLTDVVMPKMGGWALVEHLRKRNPALRIVLMSGYAGGMSTIEAIKRSGIRFVPKPFSSSTILAALRAAFSESPH